jgi:hypothetical protein
MTIRYGVAVRPNHPWRVLAWHRDSMWRASALIRSDWDGMQASDAITNS